MKKTLTTMVFACFVAIGTTFAQQDLKAALPKDANVITGKLKNGMTYYIRKNAEPKDRASFYIIQNVGALLENDNQNGLAHFLEHMAFNGTKNFPDKGIITMLEKHGVAFGRDINAYTAQDETVYNLSSVPTNNESLLDSCLLVLNDWSHYLALENDEIDAERGVISEEWRTRRNSSFRIRSQISPVLFKGSKYAERDVIGDLDVIKNFDYQTLKDFYHDWYRTDLQAIAVVGDFDPVKMEAKIKKLFSQIPPVKNAQKRPSYDIPEHEEIYYVLATDKEATGSSIGITTILPESKTLNKNTNAYLKDNIVNSLYNSMIGARISEMMQKGNPPFLNGSIGFGGFTRGYNSYNISAGAKPNQEDIALEAILTENERIRRFGFSDSELERAKTNTLAGFETVYKQKDKIDNENYIAEIKANFLEQEPIVDLEYYYNFIKNIMPTITAKEVAAKAQGWNTTKNRTITITGPSEGSKHLTKEEVLAVMDKVSKAKIEPYQDNVSDAELISENLAGGKIVNTKKLPEFDAEEWTLSNGAKVVFRKADYDKDQVTLSAYSKGGTSLYGADMLPSAGNVAGFVNAYGLGDFDAPTLRKLLTGKMVGCSVSLGGLSESVNGSATPKDIETMFQLLYLRFEKPRFDKEAHEALMIRNRANIANMQKNPQKVMQDSMSLIMSNYNPRTQIFNEEYLDKIDIAQIEKIYRDRFKDASDFTFFIVGNVDAETVKPLVEKYIGSLKSENRKENWVDNKVRMPKGKTVKEIEVALETPKSSVLTYFSKDMDYSMYNNICNNILKGILDLRYTENIREKEGGTYGVGVQAGATREPYQNYSMTMMFDCDPAKAAHLKSLIYAETEKLMKEGPTAEEVDKIVKNMMKEREQSKLHNSYWSGVISGYYISGINTNDPKNYEDILAKITPSDIQKFTQKLFTGADVVDITFKPKN